MNGKKVYDYYSSEGSGSSELKEVASIKAVPSGYNKIKLSWSKVRGTGEYAVYRATEKMERIRRLKQMAAYLTAAMKIQD
ncbi:hypothetical protein [Planomicrobium soli]|uniref:hypothetical protein n=1 Tax=Planomicrobium soli TaxID=1176648 RepID=UPI000D0E0790|nr:hypothetical protein [Planomicrobium soli]